MADLDKVRRLLQDLMATGEFLRQYPGLADKLRAALERAETPSRPATRDDAASFASRRPCIEAPHAIYKVFHRGWNEGEADMSDPRDMTSHPDDDPRCLRCGFVVPDRPRGCKWPCPNCGYLYPLGDCSD